MNTLQFEEFLAVATQMTTVPNSPQPCCFIDIVAPNLSGQPPGNPAELFRTSSHRGCVDKGGY